MIPIQQNNPISSLKLSLNDAEQERALAFREALIAHGGYDDLVAAIDAAELSLSRYLSSKGNGGAQ